MFENSGSKVKVIAIIVFILECLGGIVGGIVVWTNTYHAGFPLFLAIAVGGFLTAWISALILYAIGEAAEGAEYVRSLCARESRRETNKTNAESAPAAVTHKPDASSMTLACPKCGTKNDVARVFCIKCGERLS